jgi:small conductance mechanosensitive channel
MLHRVASTIVFSLLFLAPVAARGQEQSEQSPPTTQQARETPNDESKSEKLIDSLSRTGFGQIFQGEKAITWKDVLDPEFWIFNVRDLVWTLLGFIPRLIGTFVFLLVFWLIYRGIRKMAVSSMKRSEVDSSIREMLGTLIKWAVMGFGIVIACNQLGIPIVAMLTGVSIIGLAVGFAAQETLANFIAGIVIFLDKPFKVGDWVEIDNTFGQVKRVTFRSTRVLTLDGEVHVFPNTRVLNNKLSNHSTNPINRVNVAIGVAYKESIDRARETLLALTKNDKRLVQEPPPEVVVNELADSSVNLLLRFWIADESIERRIGYEYTEKAKNALDAAGIEIPFPHMQLFIENTPAVSVLAGNGSARGVN